MALVVQVRLDTTCYKYLSTIRIGGIDIRYMSVNENNIATFPTSLRKHHGRVLFLASDVLSGTSVTRKNHIRVHTRYAKEGLASKLSLEGFKVEGINNSSTMWFYSIQGLFKVAFELHAPETQRDCLLKLQWLWLEGYTDPLLPSTWVVQCAQSGDGSVISTGTAPQNKDAFSALSEHCSLLASSLNSGPVLNQKQSVEPETNREVKIENGYHGNVYVERPEHQHDEAGDFVEHLIAFVRKSISESGHISEQVVFQILLALDYLKHVSSQDNEHFADWGLSLFELMERYLKMSKYEAQSNCFRNTFGLSKEQYILLYVVSEWVGSEFHEMESRISSEVEDFKKRNISSVDNLPPAAEMIDILFPSCMKRMMINWLGVSDNESTSENYSRPEKQPCSGEIETVTVDHNYSPPCKMKRETKNDAPSMINKPLYSLIQLILEFATNSLVSGVAHVVYTRLRHTT